MQKIFKPLLLLTACITLTILPKPPAISFKNLTLETKHVYKPNTNLRIEGIPCSSGTTRISVDLICSSTVNKKAVTTFFLSPMFITRYGNNGNYTCTYEYNLRELKDFTENVKCKLRVVTTSITDLSALYHSQDVKEYYFEVAPLSGLAKWVGWPF